MLAAQIFAPAAFGLPFFDLAPGGGFDIGLALAQLEQDSGILDFLFELAHGTLNVAILYYHCPTVER